MVVYCKLVDGGCRVEFASLNLISLLQGYACFTKAAAKLKAQAPPEVNYG